MRRFDRGARGRIERQSRLMAVTPRRHDRPMKRSRTIRGVLSRSASRPRPGRVRAYRPDLVVGKWWCPVCGAPAHRTARPGRPKVYCSNACRQRAYRERRGARACRTPSSPARTAHVRGRSRDRSHAVRPAGVFPWRPPDSHGRELSLCGAFVRRADPRRWRHTRFVPDLEWSCRSCVRLGVADAVVRDVVSRESAA